MHVHSNFKKSVLRCITVSTTEHPQIVGIAPNWEGRYPRDRPHQLCCTWAAHYSPSCIHRSSVVTLGTSEYLPTSQPALPANQPTNKVTNLSSKNINPPKQPTKEVNQPMPAALRSCRRPTGATRRMASFASKRLAQDRMRWWIPIYCSLYFHKSVGYCGSLVGFVLSTLFLRP